MDDESALAMFPLGSVLFPYAGLPLHVFEPRYRVLVETCLRGEPEFGVVLIERGSEVGGGDTRFGVGTVARIVRGGRLPDGRYVLATIGTRRVRVRRWLPDDPYPRAEVSDIDEPPAGPDDVPRAAEVARLLTRLHELRAGVGDHALADEVELSTDPGRAAYEAAALAMLGPLDAQRVLEAPGPGDRLESLAALLADEIEILELRLDGR